MNSNKVEEQMTNKSRAVLPSIEIKNSKKEEHKETKGPSLYNFY